LTIPTSLSRPFHETGQRAVDGVEVIDGIVHGIEHIAPNPDFGIGPDVADDLGGLFDVPCEQFAGSHFFAWQAAQWFMTRSSSCDMKRPRDEKGRWLVSLRRAIHRKFWIR